MKHSLIGSWGSVVERTRDRDVPVYKRLLDWVCIILLLPCAFPTMLLIALLIKLVSPGPVFFRQERIGLFGRPFRLWKFRTMRVGADTKAHESHIERIVDCNLPMTKMDRAGDPRLIPLGAFLRASGLDELPQVLNVLRGEMSLVGPRPCTPYEYRYYVPLHKSRFETPPGLTGLWQISGKNRTTFSQMVDLDLAYVRNRSLLLDIRIILKTASALITQVNELRSGPHVEDHSELKRQCCDAEVISG